MTKDEALKMAIDVMEGRCAWGKSKQEVIAMCQEALEHQEVGDAEIKQMLNDIEYYKNRLAKYEDVL